MYIKLNNGKIEKYPYNINQLYEDNPQVSFPSILNDVVLSEYGVYEILKTDNPTYTYKQYLVEETPIKINDKWTQVWSVKDKSIDEINAIHESNRKEAYKEESDPLFFKWQRGESTQQEWLDKVNEIKQRWV